MPGNRVGSARTRSHDDNTGFARGTGVAIGLMSRTLLMASKDMVDLLRIVQGIIDLDSLTTWITEYRVHAFGFERSDDGSAPNIFLPCFSV